MKTHLDREIPAFDQKKMMGTIEAAKKEYRKQMLLEPMSGWEFLFQQMIYLSKAFWIIQLVVFLVSAFSLAYINLIGGLGMNKISYCAIYAPLLIIFSIPELWKNISNNAYEVESTTYFDLRKVYLSRLVLVGMMDLLLATILTVITAKTNHFPIYEAVIYFFVPFNFTCCICFSLLCCKKKICSEFLAVVGCIGGAAFWCSLVRNYNVYKLLEMKIWYGLLGLSFVYLVFVGKRIASSSRGYLEVCQ